MNQPPAAAAVPGYLVELAFRLGVPTFILVLAMFMVIPRIDRGITVAERVDAGMSILISDCISDRRSIVVSPPSP